MRPGERRALRRALAALAGLALCGALSALATPRYRLQAIEQLHYDELSPLWAYDNRVMACTYCHVKVSGGAPWNPFGNALRAGFRADAQAGGKAKFADVLYRVLRANGDSDGDGYPDALEVFAHTLPGDSASYPDKPLAELDQKFAAAGGVEHYAPRHSAALPTK